MTPHEIGLIYNQLLERRVLYSFSVPGRNRSQAEKEAVASLERNRDYVDELEGFLETQGLRLVSHEAAALGIADAGRVYVAVREPVRDVPAHIGGAAVLREWSDSRRNESAADSALWAGLLLMAMLKLLYTDGGRPIESVSGFADAEFDDSQFVDTLLEAIEKQRGVRVTDDSQVARAHALFTGSAEAQVEARAKGFVRSMLRGGVLEERTTGMASVVYGQTLWSAVDVAENFKRYAGALIPRPVAKDIVALVSADEISSDDETIQEN